MTVAEMLRRFKSFDAIQESKEIINETGNAIIELNQGQLLQGLGQDGSSLPYYRPFEMDDGRQYSEVKASMNSKSGGRYDMRYSGYSFSTMKVLFENGQLFIKSQGVAQDYEDGAFDRESWLQGTPLKDKIFGLNEDNKVSYRENVLLPKLVERLANKTGAKTN